jgi:hypothetical protein
VIDVIVNILKRADNVIDLNLFLKLIELKSIEFIMSFFLRIMNYSKRTLYQRIFEERDKQRRYNLIEIKFKSIITMKFIHNSIFHRCSANDLNKFYTELKCAFMECKYLEKIKNVVLLFLSVQLIEAIFYIKTNSIGKIESFKGILITKDFS